MLPLLLRAAAQVGTKHYYVREGAATVDSDTGEVTFLPLPPKARRPHRVTIVEWTWGGDARETAYWR